MQRACQPVLSLCQHGCAGRRLDNGRRGRMVAMSVGDEDMSDGFAAHGFKQCRDMEAVVGAGIDDRYLIATDDVADRTFESERAGIVGRNRTHPRRHFLDLIGRKSETLVEWNVVTHWPAVP